MASLIQYPASLSLSGNLNKVIISASESVRFTLLKGATTVLDERYRAIGGMVEIDISSVVGALLSLSIPTTDVFQQSGIYADFTIQLDGVTAATFRCIRAGVDAESINATTFLAANFLTWQPQTKRVRRLGPEYLTYYFTQAASVKVRYYTANGNTVVTLHSAATGTCYTYNMQMQHLLSLSGAPANAYGIIDVWVETSGGTRLSYVQRYVYSPQEKEDRHFLFENSVGGLDGVTFSGSETVTVNNDYDAAEYQERLVQIPGDVSTRHRQRTGQLTPVEARWIRDLFTSQRVYATDGSTVRLIVLTEADTGDDSDENIKSLSFTWRPTDDRGLQNAVRTTDALPNSLPIQIPDSELFFLEARLVDLPEGRLDPTTLIPIQSPFAENWSRITWGALHDTLMGEVNDNITTALQVLNSYVLKSEWEADKEAIYEYIAALAGEISELPWDSLDETEAILSSGLAKAYARLTSLEDWLRKPSFDELAAHSVCSEEITTRKIWLTEETYLETDENGNIHINAGLWSDSFLTAGGQGDGGGGGGGGGGLDLGLMWSSLTNTTIATADVTSATSINPSHLPAWSVQGTGITGSVVTAYNSETHAATAVLSLALATTGVTAGTYNSVTVDQYGRVTAGSSSANDDLEEITAAGIAMLSARVSSLEDWLRDPAFDEITASTVGTQLLDLAGYILEVADGNMALGFGLKDVGDIVPLTTAQKNIGSTDHWWNNIYVKRIYFTADTYLEYDGDNTAVKLNGNTYATGFITAGGIGSGGGGGGGGVDLGAVWTTLINSPITTANIRTDTKIALDHIPDIPHTKVTGLGQAATINLGAVAAGNTGVVNGGQVYTAIQAALAEIPDTQTLTSGIASVTARVSSLEDWLREPAFDEVAVAMLNVADVNFGRLLRNDELEHNKVTIAGLEVALGGTISLTDLEGVLGTTPLVGGLATVSARVASLEDWLRNPALDTLEVYDLCAGRGAFRGAAYMYSTLDVTGLVTFAGTAKLTGTTKKIWFGDSIYIELDSNGYLHTNAGFYSESFITAGGLGSGGSGSGVDLGSVWSSLTNTTMATTDVTNSTHINPSHIPAITISGGSYYQGTTTTDWNATTRQGTITIALLPKTTGVVAGTYTSVTVDQYGRVTAGTDAEGGSVDASITGGIASNAARIASLEDWLRDPALDELAVGTLNARSLNLGTKIANDLLEHDGLTIANTLVHLGGEMSKDQLRSLLEINNVENTKLSTWTGTTNITVLGTVATGVWHGTAIANDYIANPRVRINGTWVYLGDTYSTGAISPGTAGGSADTSGVSFAVPYVTMSSYGIVTGYGTHTHSISGSQLVSAIGNNYVNNASYATNAGNATNATYATYDEDQYRFRVYYAGSLVVDSGLKLKSRNGSTLSTISSTDLVSAIGNSAVNRATGDESGNRILTGYGATLSAASNALKLLSMSGATISTITAANLVTVLGTTPVNRATADANGNNIASSYLSTAGGTIAGDLRLQSGSYGQHLYFGDGAYCYIHEDTDDHMTLYGDKGITLSTRSGYGVTVTYDMTVNGKLYITSNAYLEYSSGNAGIHFSKGLYSDYYITAGSSSSSSDARMKTNMEDVKLTVAQIAAAPAVTFDWIEEWRGKGAGSIAQYWQPILPYNVKRWDGDLLSMEYGNIALLSAITVAREVVSQGRKINSLDNRLKVVERQLSIN